jgi:hypothetical protein
VIATHSPLVFSSTSPLFSVLQESERLLHFCQKFDLRFVVIEEHYNAGLAPATDASEVAATATATATIPPISVPSLTPAASLTTTPAALSTSAAPAGTPIAPLSSPTTATSTNPATALAIKSEAMDESSDTSAAGSTTQVPSQQQQQQQQHQHVHQLMQSQQQLHVQVPRHPSFCVLSLSLSLSLPLQYLIHTHTAIFRSSNCFFPQMQIRNLQMSLQTTPVTDTKVGDKSDPRLVHTFSF